MYRTFRKSLAFITTAGFLLSTSAGLSAAPNSGAGWEGNENGIKRVLLISIDGMHVVDLINCSEGLTDINGGAPYCPNLLRLRATGVNYLETSTSKPSDSFPGLTAIISGGSPRTEGVFYDVAYDRSLAPPARTTGNGVAAGPCEIGMFNGTTTEYEEGIDINQNLLNGGAPTGGGGVNSIDTKRLPRDPANECKPVYPWNFVRTNTIFGVIHQAGGYTAWSDKHPAYSSVSGPTASGHPVNVAENLDDFYSPEINSIPISLPVVLPAGQNLCNPIADPNFPSGLGAYTDSFVAVKCYDTLKVNAILNQIDGYNHDRTAKTKVPTIFGMNFQAVSVGQKLIEPKVGTGGYVDAIGTPTTELLAEIAFVDASIGKFVAELKKTGNYDSTLIVITAKHGQSPIDSSRYTGITASGPVTTSPATILDNGGGSNSCLPFSASPSNPTGIGPTEDDISLLWLSSNCTVEDAVNMLQKQSPAATNIAGIGQIFSGPALRQMFNPPGFPPVADPRSPDIIVTPNIGVTYSGSTKKLAEHGGFSHDDTNVVMLLSYPSFQPKTITSPVETMQVAPTILKALGLDPYKLQAVSKERTQVLPGLTLD
jgi:Type I phosphodiesterase / nucleotide pyrophosphatase